MALALVAGLGLAACSSLGGAQEEASEPVAAAPPSRAPSTRAPLARDASPIIPQLRNRADVSAADISATDVPQLARSGTSVSPQSGLPMAGGDPLSVGQLKTYADRCRTVTAPPPELDCAGLRLRVERLFRSDDDVVRALAVLDQLPGDTERLTPAELFVRQAIISGALVPEPPPEPEPEETPSDLPDTDILFNIIGGPDGG